MGTTLAKVGPEFLETAPVQITYRFTVNAPKDKVWEAVSDPENWPRFFKGCKSCRWTSEATRTVGATRRIELSGMAVDEEFTVWEEGERFVFAIVGAKPGLLSAGTEGIEVSEQADGSTEVTWRSGIAPRPGFLNPVVKMAFTRGLRKGFAGLEPFVLGR